ncbi:ABC transporter substrate-binding protein [Bradyrhizobium lablabi]|uniref:ABC transporter substrate-binding protein n=1 Tax=Bradyrhizobium lablabi TaxID=722472 RepID=UPI001BA48882|nr:ABC transporter substrate-binding protein [Bradyrhizobium lablabi]MBR1124243.1 ABC transporter substrate-binding protein [Bradyrhizobium lablabi]
MRRREFITLVGAAAAWPLVSRAQQAKIPVVAFLGIQSATAFAERLNGFKKGLSEAGYVDGRNVTVEYISAEGRTDQFPKLAADLVLRQVDAIALAGLPAVLAAKAATTRIPIIFTGGFDPVAFKVVASLNRPGGNITGITELGVVLAQKRLELMHELIPAATTFALLVNPANPNAETTIAEVQAAARMRGLQLHILRASTEQELDIVLATLVQLRAKGLVIAAEPFLGSRTEQIAKLANRYAVPTISQFRIFVANGGLMSYGGDIVDQHRRVGIYTGRILKGEKPADLPVEQATKVELIINLRTAKALGVAVPSALLARADEVIE